MKKQDLFVWALFTLLCVWASLTCCGAVYNVSPSQPLQPILDSAVGGDEIVLESGGVWKGSFLLPQNTSGRVITIRSTGSFSTGVRCRPGDSFAVLETPSSTPALRGSERCHDFAFHGIEFRQAATVNPCYTLVSFGYTKMNPDLQISNVADLSRNITFQHCYVHGWLTTNTQRGIALNVAGGIVRDSYFAEIHYLGVETQAIALWNSPGPIEVTNCYLSAGGMGFITGGAKSGTGKYPEKIRIRRNHFYKPREWFLMEPEYAGRKWVVKNSLELKTGTDVVISENVMENCYVMAQHGAHVVITPREADIRDVTITDNVIRWGGIGLHIAATPDSQRRILGETIIRNNLVYDISYGNQYQGEYLRGRGSMVLTGGNEEYFIEAMDVRNNTFVHGKELKAQGQESYWYGQTLVSFGEGRQIKRWTFVDNIGTSGAYLMHCSGDGAGKVGVETACGQVDQRGNVVILTSPLLSGYLFPGDSESMSLDDVFVDVQSWNLAVRPSSPHIGKGADVTALTEMAESVIRGTDAPPGEVYRVLATWTSGQHETSQEAVWSIDGAVVGTEQLPADVESMAAEMRLRPLQTVSVSIRGVNESGQSPEGTASVVVPDNPQPPPVPTAPNNVTITLEKQ